MRLWLLLCVLLLAGCAGQHGVNAKDRETVKPGVIESAAPIEMDASTNAGSMAGGIFGQVGGANSGTGRGSVVGSVLGGTIGQQAGISSKQGLEIWVKLDDED